MHWEQQSPNSCVAACICMVLQKRGQVVTSHDEAAIHHGAPAGGLPLTLVPRYLRDAQWLTLDENELLQQAPLWLALGRLLIVKVCGPLYVKLRGNAPAGLPSRHGQLAVPADTGGPFHSLVLVGKQPGGFLALDPYYPSGGQPLQLCDDELAALFACEVVVVP